MSFCCHVDLTKLTEKQCSKGGILVSKSFSEGCCVFGTVNAQDFPNVGKSLSGMVS